MGRVYAWKLNAVTSSDKSTWPVIYSWLSAPGEPTNSEEVSPFDDSYLIRSGEYAKTLGDFIAYKAAFERMMSALPRAYACTSSLKSPEYYFSDECEWGIPGQNEYCGIERAPETIITDISVTPASGYGKTYTFSLKGENIERITFYLDTTEIEYESDCDGRLCTFTGSVTVEDFATHTVSYLTRGGLEGGATFERKPISITFAETAATVPNTATTYTFNYSRIPTTGGRVTWSKSEGTTLTTGATSVTFGFPENMALEDTSYYVTATYSLSGQTATARFDLTQSARPDYRLAWKPEYKNVEIAYYPGMSTIEYTSHLIDDNEISVTCPDTSITVSKVSAGVVRVEYPENTGSTEKVFSIVLSSPYTASDTSVFTQSVGASLSIEMPECAPLSGGIVTVTATTNYARIEPEGVIVADSDNECGGIQSVNVASNTTSTQAAGGKVTISIHLKDQVNPHEPPQPPIGKEKLLIDKEGYAKKYVYLGCSENISVSISKLTTLLSVNIEATTGDGTIITDSASMPIDNSC